MLDIAYERGLLDLGTYDIDDFSDKGKKDARGLREKKTNLKLLLNECYDFMNEETMLQKTIKDLGAVCY